MIWYKVRRRRKSTVTKHYLVHREIAKQYIMDRLDFWNQFYGYQYKRVSIRNQRTRWGSCSENGNLNFSYKLYFLPLALCDYIIVHELCHLKEFNHSPAFWRLVERGLPDYKNRQQLLKRVERQGVSVKHLTSLKTSQ